MTRRLGSVIGGFLLVGLTSCGQKTGQIQPTVERSSPGKTVQVAQYEPSVPRLSTHKIGLLLPLSGHHAELGKSMLDAAELALFESGNDSVILLPLDTGQGARAAAERALQEGAELLLGPVFAGEVTEVKPLLTQHNVNLICFSTDQSVANQGAYVLGFLPAQQIEKIVDFAKRTDLKKIGALTPEDAYGQVVDRTLKHLAARGDIQLLGITHYTRGDVLEGNPGNQRILEDVNHYQNQGLQALLIPEGGENLHNLARILKREGVPLLLGSGQWDGPETLDVPELRGGVFVSTHSPERRAFEERFWATYGKAPPRIASLAYDAVAMACTLADKGYRAQDITFSQGFTGVDGLFRLTPGGLNERGLAVIEVGSSEFQPLSLAPQEF